MGAVIVVLGLLAVALYCHAWLGAAFIVVLLVSAVWHLPGRSHEQQTLHRWHRRNR